MKGCHVAVSLFLFLTAIVKGFNIVVSLFVYVYVLWQELLVLKNKMGKGSRLKRQNGNNTSSSFPPCNAKDQKKVFQSTEDKDSQPCKRCEDEIPKLRELNQLLTKDISQKNKELSTERELLSQKNKELSTDAESLKAQLNEYNARLVQIEGERVQNERVLQQCRTENIDLQSDLNDSKGRIQDLLRKK